MASTPRPKSLAFMFLLGAFVTGAAVGYAASRTTAPAVAPPARDRQLSDLAMRDSLARELHLSDAQRRSVDSVYDWRRARNKDIMDSVRPSFDATRDSARVLLMKILDPSQQADFTRIVARMQAADSVRRARDSRR